MTSQQDADAVFWGCDHYARYKSGRGQMSLFDQPTTAAKTTEAAPVEAAPLAATSPVAAVDAAPIKQPTEHDELLKQAAPYRQYGEGYNRHIATSADDLESIIARGHPEAMRKMKADELRLRLQVHGKGAVQPGDFRAAQPEPAKPVAAAAPEPAMKDIAPHMMTLADYRRNELTGRMENGAPVLDISHMTRGERDFIGGLRNAFVYEPTGGQTLVEFPKGWSLDKARQEIDEAMQNEPDMDLSRDAHREAVQKALDAGATVPEEVLSDYPGMAPKHRQPESPEDAAAKKKEAQRQKRNAAARARSDAMRSIGMKRTRSGQWE